MFISIGKRPEQTFTPAGNIFGNNPSRQRGGGLQPTLMQGSQQEKENQIARQREEELYARDQARREADRQAQFDSRKQERGALFDESLAQQARQREIQAGIRQSDAFRGLLGLYDSFGGGQYSDSQLPLSDDQIGKLDSYITGRLASGDLTRDDLLGFRRDDSFRGRTQSGFGNYVLNLIGSNRGRNIAKRRDMESRRPAGALTLRGNNLFGSEGQFLGTYGGPSGNTFTPSSLGFGT
jgi:hypothetical protein